MFNIPVEELLDHVKERRTLHETAVKFGCCEVTVFVALKRAGLQSNGRKFTAKKDPRCCRCGCTDPAKFKKRYGKAYQANPNGTWCAWCQDCYHDVSKEFKRKNRERIIEHLGGRCVLCRFSTYPSALDAHHVDPTVKDISAGNMVGWKWARLEKELRGCVLLCSNCHRGYHNGELYAEGLKKMEELSAIFKTLSPSEKISDFVPEIQGTRDGGFDNTSAPGTPGVRPPTSIIGQC